MARRRSDPAALKAQILTRALGYPGAHEDHPWGETVVKVDGKVFVFLGADDDPEQKWTPGMTAKLDESRDQALAVPGAAPAGYNLGRSGWVRVPFVPEPPPVEVLEDWVEESYRRVALKRRVKELDERDA